MFFFIIIMMFPKLLFFYGLDTCNSIDLNYIDLSFQLMRWCQLASLP